MTDSSLNCLRAGEDSTTVSYTLHGGATLACKSSVAVLRSPHPFVNLTTNEKVFGSRFRDGKTDFKLANLLPNE